AGEGFRLGRALEVPQDHLVVAARRHEVLAGLVEDDGADGAGVAAQRLVHFLVGDVVQVDGVVAAARGDRLAVGTPRHRRDDLRVVLEDMHLVAALDVPDAHGAIGQTGASGNHLGAVVVERHAGDRAGVALAGLHGLAGRHTPDDDQLVAAAGDDVLVVVGED